MKVNKDSMLQERCSKESATTVERWVTWEKIVEAKMSRKETTIAMDQLQCQKQWSWRRPEWEIETVRMELE